MRRLFPDVADESLEDLYTEIALPAPTGDRPYLYLDMVASVDGAATIDGRTRKLGGEADRRAFSRLREWCDVILVGASTVRIEDYGPPRPSVDARERRVSRGYDPYPRIAVVTASAALNPGARLFSDPQRRAIVFAPDDADARRLDALARVADVRRFGSGRVDLPDALAELRRDGVERVLCEGGPALNAELLKDGLVDELFLTVSPQLVGESAHRIVGELESDEPISVVLVEVREHRDELLLRYRLVSD